MNRMVQAVTGSFLFIIFVLAISGSAQAQNPVSLSIIVKPAKVKPGEKLTAQISASIGGGWHMYSVTQGAGGPIPTRITVADGSVFKAAGGASGSSPKREMDPNFGIMTEFYTGSASFSIPVSVDASAPTGSQTLTINVRYQVCNDTNCLPPKTIKVSAPVEIIAATAVVTVTPSPTSTATVTPKANLAANVNKNANVNTNVNTNANVTANINTETNTNTEALTAVIDNSNPSSQTSTNRAIKPTTNFNNSIDTTQSIWSFIWLAMTVGALSLLTPCVFPMIPITVSYFTNHAAGNRAGAIRDAIIYALGIILTFTALGVALALLFGAAGINQFAASPWVNIVITGIFIAFALSLFGSFNIGIPTSVLTKLDAFQRSKESGGGSIGHIIALLLMGLTFSLTSFTCTAPFVGSLLVMAAQGDWFLPVIGMLAFSTVFALPFFVLALAPQLVSQLPRSGGWLNSVKVVMGFLEIAAAMKFLSNVDLVWGWGIFTREIVLASWVTITLLIGLYLLGKFQLSHDTPTVRLGAVRLLASIVFLSLGFYFLTGLFGAHLGEIESFLPPPTVNSLVSAKSGNGTSESGGELSWITNDFKAAIEKAKQENKPVFIDFTGYTCTNCRWMESNMFPKEAVRRELEKYVRVRLYTDGEGEPYESFQQMQQDKFNTVALPLYAIVNANGDEIVTFPGLTRQEEEFVSFLQAGEERFAAKINGD